MKASDLSWGAVSTLELVPKVGPDFGVVVSACTEATLQFSDATGESLLRLPAGAWPVEGSDERGNTSLHRLRGRNLPRIAWVASARPTASSAATILVQVHEFPAQHFWPDEVDIGVDDKVVEHVRQKLGRIASASEVIQWLNDRFVMRPEDGACRVFLSGSPTPESAHGSAFRLFGRGYSVDVARGPDDKLRVSRVVETKRGTTVDERRPIVLVHGRIKFCDATIAGAFRGAARTQLDQLVEQAGSYLNIWREYNKLERDSVLRRARTLGWLGYAARQLQPDGRWRFQVRDPKQLEAALTILRGAEDADLEAALQPPPELQRATEDTNVPAEETSAPSRRERVFIGTFSGGDVGRRFIEIQPPIENDDREPPPEGVLFLSVSGDRKRLDRREDAQSLIASAECPMPQLGLLLEGRAVPERRRKTETALSAAARALFGGEPTPRQIEALRVALNTPDIALIQGPPGTGKTRTIAALEARLAELKEDSDLSGQTLLTSYQHGAVENAAAKTIVFGLPAIKVGRKRGTTDHSDSFDRWRRERIDGVRADLAAVPERPLTEVLRKVRLIAAAYVASPLAADESLRVVREVEDLCRRFISPALSDRLLALRQELSRSAGPLDGPDSDERTLTLKAVRGLRTDPVSFGDDGPQNARRALRRLELMGLHDESQRLLRAAAEWSLDEPPPFLAQLTALQGDLIDMLAAAKPVGSPMVHGDLEALLPEIVDALYTKARESAGGEDAVLYEYLDDLEHDVDGVRFAVRNYTVVLAATCQQAVGFQMSRAKGRDTVFANVIVDEAARANPLDLFIPMSLAERRIILVGDHRQLPHILEPDIESQLEQSVTEATKTALKRSLFERLFQAMRAREASDGIKRTVTLDVQYRMHPVLGAFVSNTFYAPYGEGFTSGRLANEFVHDLPGYVGRVAAWVDLPLSRGGENGGQSKRRPAEAFWIAKEVARLAAARTDLSFGVISFYAAQVDQVLEAMEPVGMSERLDDGSFRVADAWRETRGTDGHLKERLRVGTVDEFQGKEFDVVILSMTRSNDLPLSDERSLRRKFGHLMLENRLCVAMSRQQRLLVVVGDAAMLRGEVSERALRGLVAFRELCKEKHGLNLPA